LEAILSGSADEIAADENVRMICLFDHEECGSESMNGAGSTLLERLLNRLANSFKLDSENANEVEERTIRNSFLISADMAHGVHPNYSDKHEKNHRPQIHKGVVFKYNCNQRYATSGVTASLLRGVAERHGVPIQEFVVKNDSPCGSTVGPILSANTGIRAIDVGVPQLSMHSVREMCGTDDVYHYFALMKGFFQSFRSVDAAHFSD